MKKRSMVRASQRSGFSGSFLRKTLALLQQQTLLIAAALAPFASVHAQDANQNAPAASAPVAAPPAFRANSKPLLFMPEENGSQLALPQLRWSIENGTKLKFDEWTLDSATMVFRFAQTQRAKTPSSFSVSDDNGPIATHISLEWPHKALPTGTFSLESVEGETLFSSPIDEDTREDWKSRMEKALRANDEGAARLKRHASASWGLADIPPDTFKILASGKKMQACLTSKASADESLKICTAPFTLQSKNGVLSGALAPAQVTPTMLFNGQDVGPMSIATFPEETLVSLKAVLKGGASIELKIRPARPKIFDVVESVNGQHVILTGEGPRPVGKVVILKKPITHFWAPTGIDQKTWWRVSVPRQAPTLRAYGAFKVPFTFLFRFGALPREDQRLYIPNRSSDEGTYSSSPKLLVTGPKGSRVASSELQVQEVSGGRYEWTFAAPNEGTENNARIELTTLVNGQPHKWVAHHTLLRTYPYEASGRLMGIVTSDGQFIGMGEIAGAAWFENLGFTDNDWLAHHRWGLTTRYFRNLTGVKQRGGAEVSGFSAANVDLKYNIINGLWNHDELFGIGASFQRVAVGSTEGNLVGGGVYWARTMPKIFDDLFNLFPFMRYPKYVDMEFFAYPMALGSLSVSRVSTNLNFHGKVFWTHRIYGEAGFGIKSLSYADISNNTAVNLATAYATFGLGALF